MHAERQLPVRDRHVERPTAETQGIGEAREAFRQHSYVSGIAVGVISGFGPNSYRLGLEALIHHLRGD